MTRSQDKWFYGLLGATALIFAYLIGYVFWVAPVAQLQAGGLAQKIFYFHVPAAYAMYLCGAVCCVASAMSLATSALCDWVRSRWASSTTCATVPATRLDAWC